MENHLLVSTQENYFFFFYNLAFFIGLVVLCFEGFKRRFPMMRWVLLLTFTWLALVIGSKLITYSLKEWGDLLTNLSLPPVTQKNLTGGLIGGTLALVAGRYLLNFRYPFANAFAYVVPLSIAIQRIGCFLTGCCHGTPSGLPWAVRYPVDTLPHFHQYSSGLITTNDVLSMPVHPVQLYETAGCLLIILVLFRLRKALKADGSLMLASMILLCAERFINEFFRDPLAHTGFLQTGRMVTIFHGLLLFTAILLSFILIRRELKFRKIMVRQDITHDSMTGEGRADINTTRASGVLLLYILIIITLRNWFIPAELLSLLLLLITGVAFLITGMIRRFHTTPVRLVYLTSMILAVLLMSQTYPAGNNDSTLTRIYKTISLGIGGGNYFNSYTLSQGCDQDRWTGYFRQKYTLGGAGYSITRENIKSKERFTYGVNVLAGQHEETRLSGNISKKEFLLGFNPYLGIDSRWYAFKGGVHLGNLVFSFENMTGSGDETPLTGIKNIYIFPQASFRIGARDIFFFDLHLADQFPSALPGYRFQFGLGSGFGQRNGFLLRTGTSLNGFYLTSYLPVKDKFVIEPLLLYNNKPKVTTEKGFQFSLGLGYRFGQKTK